MTVVGPTLREIRTRVEDLSCPGGDYGVVCARTGERPVPVAGLRFPDRERAVAAARAAEQYRAALRRYDPTLPWYDLVVCERPDAVATVDRWTDEEVPADDREGWNLTAPVLDAPAPTSRSLERVEVCHLVAAAVFETLSDRGDEAVERAIVDDYLALAERLSDPDDLCLCLLESAATELDRRLEPARQAAVLADAAERLPRPPRTDEPVHATLARLERVGLLADFSWEPGSIWRPGGARSAVAEVSSYSLSPTDEGLPVLPIVLDLVRRRPADPPRAVRATPLDAGWRLIVVFGQEVTPGRLATAPIRAVP